jgi:integrase
MAQQGQVFPLAGQGSDGTRWAYRYRTGGRGSRRMPRGGFASKQAAADGLERALEQPRREQGLVESPTLAEFVDLYLAQHEGEPETTEKLRWRLAKAVRVFGERRLSQLRSPAIAAWRMTVPPGHRFEATQALRQVLARAVNWGLLDVNPAKLGVENPQRRYREKRPFESWEELHLLAGRLGRRYGPIVVFAAATGLRPGEWLALEHRDIDREAQVVYVRRTFRNGRIKTHRAGRARRATRQPALPARVPAVRGGYLDLHNFRNRAWKPAQRTGGIEPLRRVYDLRHTFATFALGAGISTFDLSRYMGTSLAMIDRHYGHLARDGREHAIKLLDTYRAAYSLDVHAVDAGWTSNTLTEASRDNRKMT